MHLLYQVHSKVYSGLYISPASMLALTHSSPVIPLTKLLSSDSSIKIKDYISALNVSPNIKFKVININKPF